MEGRVLSKKLRIKRKLGSGGMGAVYEVENIHNKTKLAVKLLKEEAAASEEVRARFISESSRMFRLIHPNIVRALDYDFEEGFGAYFTMDLVHGKDLKQLLEEDRDAGKPPWPIDRIKRIGMEVASALNYAYSKWSLVHRDIKPANILIREEDGAAIVTDFGIAKRTQRVEGETTDFTTTERFVGTVRYSSPEQLQVEDLDQRADIYSLGAVLYEMATGRRFLERMKESEIQARTMYFPDWDWKAELPFPEGMVPALRVLIEACVERRRENRIATASDLMERLGRCDERHIEIVPIPKPVEDQTVIPGFDDIRGKLRQEAENLLQRLAELGQVAVSVGVTIEPEQSDTFRARLEAIAQIERAGAYNDAVHQLGEVGELVEREHGALQQRVREAIDQSRDEVAEAWADLVARANGLIDERRSSRFERTLTEIVACLGGEDWRAASARLAEAREVQAEAEANARRLAERETREAVESVRRAADQLAQNDSLPAGFDRAAVETRIETALAEGRYAEARAAASTALNGLDVARTDWIGRQRQRAVAARDAMTAFLRALDIQAMPEAAAPLVRQAQEHALNADTAMRNENYTGAAESFDRALSSYREAQERARLDGFTASLRDQHGALTNLEQLRQRADDAGIESAEIDLTPARRALQELEERRPELSAEEAQAQLAASATLVDNLRGEVEGSLREAIAGAIGRAAVAWEEFAAGAGQFVGATQSEEVAAAVAAAQARLAGQDLETSLHAPAELRGRVTQLQLSVTNAARAEVEQLFERAEDQHAKIVALDPSALPAGIDFDELRRDVERELNERRLAQVDELASTALNQLSEALTALKRADEEKAQASRQGMAAAAATIDSAEAARASPADAAAAAAAREQGDSAFSAGDHRAAAVAYGEAQRAYEQVARAITEARATAAEQLREGLERARDQPLEVVGELVRRGEGLLSGEAKVNEYEQVLADLEAGLTQVGPFKAACVAQEKCKSAEDRVLRRSPAVLARRAIRRRVQSTTALRTKAETELQKRSWAPAAESFAAATEAWTKLEPEIDRYEKQPPRPSWMVPVGVGVPLVAIAGIGLWLWTQSTPEEKVPPKPPVQEQPKEPEKPKVVPFKLERLQPGSADVSMKEGVAQEFAIAVAGGAPGEKADLRWSLDGKPLDAKDVQWTYRPDFKAAQSGPHAVRVQVGGDETSSTEWKVQVEDVNRAPIIVEPKNPDPVKVGETVTVRADASDADDDALEYAWTVDGKAAGKSEPQLALKVSGDHEVAVAVTDKKVAQAVTAAWRVAALAPALPQKLEIAVQPASLGTVQFRKSQEFRLSPPADAQGLKYDWRVNGAKVQGTARYVFPNDDAALAGKSVKVEVNVVDGSGRTFAKSWPFRVGLPASPKIGSPKPSSPIEAKAGSPVELSLTPGQTVDGQTLSYRFAIDGGSEQTATNPRFQFTPKNAQHTIVARAVDNFGQRSDPITWRISIPEPPPAPAIGPAQVQAWLESYRTAFVQKDINALSRMMQLSADKADTLRKQLALQEDLNVAFSGVNVEPLGNGRFRASYSRRDSFTNAQTGKPFNPPAFQVRQEFTTIDGRIQLVK